MQIVKKYTYRLLIKYFLIFYCASMFEGCSLNNGTLREKIYHQQIDSGLAIKIIRGGGGEFDIVYRNKVFDLDTIYVDGYSPIGDDIDTLTILYKDSLSNLLRLENLKALNNKRYTKTIDLMRMFNQ